MEKFDCNDPDIQQRLVAENRLGFAFLNKMPIVPGHILICPKRAVATSRELTFDEWKDLLVLKELVCTKLKLFLQAKGFNFAWNENLIAGQTVPHFHLHIVPRKENDAGIIEYEPRVFLYRPGSRATSSKEELVAFANELRKL